jgi:hypothetical protein
VADTLQFSLAWRCATDLLQRQGCSRYHIDSAFDLKISFVGGVYADVGALCTDLGDERVDLQEQREWLADSA